ncbi:hypothetical protein MASR2M70_11920 [Bacillota bacterium]
MLSDYPAIFHKEDDKFWVEFPDLPGCQSCGDTLENTMELAQEAMSLYIATKIIDQTKKYEPSNKLPKNKGWFY